MANSTLSAKKKWLLVNTPLNQATTGEDAFDDIEWFTIGDASKERMQNSLLDNT
ncbi:hypothetical protein [Oceanisphaera marina]|uniref:hypothetical protein n=1 Tax=Oceanisphaera marina TaxID=2017550 RepID=UPI001E56F8FD|nr:hypothetical protein [Oceanisphaera marina]